MLSSFGRPVMMVGCGNMAGAMLVRWLECGLDPALVTIVDPARREAPGGVALLSALPIELPVGTVIVLGIKPQGLGTLASELAPLLAGDNIVISMLAGITLAGLGDALGSVAQVVRIMPNTPVALGVGVCAVCPDRTVSDGSRQLAEELLAPLGLVEWMADEEQMNLVTALSGSGPAFVYRFIDALAIAARDLGMDEALAGRMALATVAGAAALAQRSTETPGELAERVASPGGTTRAGLSVLDAQQALVSLLEQTLRAARDRGEELARPTP